APPGPRKVPSAANSFTSPAPVAPTTWPGSMTKNPTSSPAIACGSVTAPIPNAAAARPARAVAPVSTFGMRRVRRSMAVLDAPPAAMAATVIGSEILSNVQPEHVVDRVAEYRHRAGREDRDERGEQPVLEQVLTVGLSQHPADGGDQLRHRNHSSSENRAADRARHPPRPDRSRRLAPYEAALSLPAMLLKMLFTLLPASWIAPKATSAMSATSSAYSSRSCPLSSFANERTMLTNAMTLSSRAP